MNYNPVVMESFGKWLYRHRKAKNLTQGDVAKRAGVSVSYVSTIERDQPHSTTGEEIRPERNKVESLAKAVGGDIDHALHLAGYASSSENSHNLPAFLYQIDFSIFPQSVLDEIQSFIQFKADRLSQHLSIKEQDAFTSKVLMVLPDDHPLNLDRQPEKKKKAS